MNGQRSTATPGGFTLVELLVVIAIIGILVGLMLPGISASRASARRMHCQRNLSKLVMAALDYELANGHFPPGVINDTGPILNEPKGNHHNWMGAILAYADEGGIASHIDPLVSVYDAQYDALRNVGLNVLLCPSDVSPPLFPRMSCYAGIHHDVEAPIDSDNHGILFLGSAITRDDITDGSAHTILLAEKKNQDERDLGWLSGTRATLRNTGTPINATDPNLARQDFPPGVIEPGPPNPRVGTAKNDETRQARLRYVGGVGSSHPNGAMVAFADGSVEFINDLIDPQVFTRLGHRSDGGLIQFQDYR